MARLRTYSFLSGDGQVKCERGLITANPETQETGMTGVFAGGDAGKGPGAIIDAIAAGRRAATAIDEFLGGDGVISERYADKADTGSYAGARDRGFADLVGGNGSSSDVGREEEQLQRGGPLLQ